jgi:hypothetical protein
MSFLYSRQALSKQIIRSIQDAPTHLHPIALSSAKDSPIAYKFTIKHITNNTIIGKCHIQSPQQKKPIPFFGAKYMYLPEGYLLRDIPTNILSPYNVFIPENDMHYTNHFYLPPCITAQDELIFLEFPN